MIKLNLNANTPAEQEILEYLENKASETLAEKINNGTPFEKDDEPLLNKKTLSGFMKYACDEARKLAEKGANSACIDDATVYGWAVHYFEEDSIEGTLYTLDGEEYKPAVKAKNAQKNDLYAHFCSETAKSAGFFIRYYFTRKQYCRNNGKRAASNSG